MKRHFLALAVMLAVMSRAPAAPVFDTSQQGFIAGTVDLSNTLHAPVSCRVTVTTTATLLSTLMGSGAGDGCSAPSWATSAFVKAPNSNLPAFCYSQEATLTSACLRGQEVPGWVDYPVPATGLGATYFVVPSGTAQMIIEWRG